MSAMTLPPQAAMLEIISGFWASRIIYAFAKLGIPDLIHDQPQTAEELASLTNTHAPSLFRFLRGLASVGVVTQDTQRRFSLTPLGETLRSNTLGSMRAFVISALGGDHYASWGELLYGLQTGKIAFEHVYGMPVWKYYGDNPEIGAVFNESMTSLSISTETAVLEAYSFPGFNTLVDVGGGHGSFLTSVLKANVDTQGILFDAPSVVEGARKRIEAAGLSNRCQVMGGDFFQEIPSGGDAYVFKWIIHDWDDEQCLVILKNCHRAMKQQGKLFLVEAVIPDDNEPSFGKMLDLNMLVMTGGKERTAQEFADLFSATDFQLNQIIPTKSGFCVIQADRV